MALNLANDVATGRKGVEEARDHYAQEFLAYRKKEPTPYMEGLKFQPSGGPDPDSRILSDEELGEAEKEGLAKQTD